jgi:hypothetical protein
MPDSKPSPDGKPTAGKKGKPTPGVRGPGGPPPPPKMEPKTGPKTGKATPAPTRSALGPMPRKPASALRRKFEDRSLPLVQRLSRMPKFLIIVTPGMLLFFGLALTGSLAWLGGILLLFVAAILAWLTALSWPVVGMGSKFMRVVVILVVFGFAVLKFRGRF